MVMSRWERVRAAVNGNDVDRPPFGLWRHFYDAEDTGDRHYQAMVRWQKRHDFDFLKVNPRAHYHVEGWGVRYAYDGSGAKPIRLAFPVQSPADLPSIRPLSLNTAALSEQLDVLRRLASDFQGQVPFIETVFNPLSILADLCESDDALVEMIRTDPALVEEALESIVATFQPFVVACLESGASGIFFATTTWATSDRITREDYERFGRAFDQRMIKVFDQAAFNIWHVCQNNSYVRTLADYPITTINWAVGAPGNPSLAEMRATWSQKALVGGLTDGALTARTPDRVVEEVRHAISETSGSRFLLAGQCSISTDSRDSNIDAARQALGSVPH